MLEINSKFITKCNSLFLQNTTAFFLQSASSVITNCDRYYKVRRLLQSSTEQGILGLTFARYMQQAPQSPYPIIVYSVANYRPHLSHSLANVILRDPLLVTFYLCILTLLIL